MKWVLREMKPGDLVRIPMGALYHYGVCTGENRVVEFGEPIIGNPLPREQIRVMAVDIPEFLHGEFAEIAEPDRKECRQRRPLDEIVANAENSIGRGGYDLLYNNCEHFAWECVFGRHFSQQVDSVRQSVEEKLPSIHVFIAQTAEYADSRSLPPCVRKELKKISDPRAAAERAAGCRLLKAAAERAYHMELDMKKCRRSANGKLIHKDLNFSVSHASGLTAVAVSHRPVDIDLEPFLPGQIDTTAHQTAQRRFEWENKEFCISVAADSLLSLHWHQELLPDLKWKE